MRSKLVFSALQDDLPDLFTGHADRLTARFTQLAQDEKLIGVGYCQGKGEPVYRNKDFPPDISCPDTTSVITKPEFKEEQTIGDDDVLVATFPVTSSQGLTRIDRERQPRHRP